MPRTSRRRSGGRSAKRRYWSGLQWPETAIPATTAKLGLVLIDRTTSERMDRTMVAIRGFITLQNGGLNADTTTVNVLSKIMLVRLNDAGDIPSDYQPIDTHQEDISDRQCWSHQVALAASGTNLEIENPQLTIEINVKVKWRIPPDGKHAMILMQQADLTLCAISSGYLRALTVR